MQYKEIKEAYEMLQMSISMKEQLISAYSTKREIKEDLEYKMGIHISRLSDLNKELNDLLAIIFDKLYSNTLDEQSIDIKEIYEMLQMSDSIKKRLMSAYSEYPERKEKLEIEITRLNYYLFELNKIQDIIIDNKYKNYKKELNDNNISQSSSENLDEQSNSGIANDMNASESLGAGLFLNN